MEWRNTPRANGVSPAQAFLGRRLRGCIPALPTLDDFNVSLFRDNKEKELSKIKNSVGGTELPQLVVGDSVSIQDPKLGWWSGRGVVSEIRPSGSVIIENDAGRFIRKRRHVRKLPKNYSVPLPGDYLADADSALASPEFEGSNKNKLSLKPAIRRSSRLKTSLANTVCEKKAGAFGGVSFNKWKRIKQVPKDQELAPKSSDPSPILFPEHGVFFLRDVCTVQASSCHLLSRSDRPGLLVSRGLRSSPKPKPTPTSTDACACSPPTASSPPLDRTTQPSPTRASPSGGRDPAAPAAGYVAESSPRGIDADNGGLLEQSADQGQNCVPDHRKLFRDTPLRDSFALNRVLRGDSHLFRHTLLCDLGGLPAVSPPNAPPTGVLHGPTALQPVASWPGPPWASMVLHGPPWSHPCSHGIGSDPPPVHASIGGGSSPLTEPSD